MIFPPASLFILGIMIWSRSLDGHLHGPAHHNAGGQKDCASQYRALNICITKLGQTPEAKYIYEKKKYIVGSTCAKNYPTSCYPDWDAIWECSKHIFTEDKLPADEEAVRNRTAARINKCFETQPSNPFGALEPVFMPAVMKQLTEIPPPATAEKPKDDKAAQGGSPVPAPPQDLMLRQECARQPAQIGCVLGEMVKALTNDPDFKRSFNTLMDRNSKECDVKLQPECRLTTSQLEQCYWEAHGEISEFTWKNMRTCIQAQKKTTG